MTVELLTFGYSLPLPSGQWQILSRESRAARGEDVKQRSGFAGPQGVSYTAQPSASHSP